MKTLLVFVVTMELFASAAEAQFPDSGLTVIPGIYGRTWSEIPFGDLISHVYPPMRMQQVYDSSAFPISMSQGGWITGMWLFSDDQAGHAWDAEVKTEFLLGLTSRRPDSLSSVFGENFSGPAVAVRPRGPLFMVAHRIFVDFVNPFFYVPAAGNLLLEIKNYNLPPTNPFNIAGPLDAWNVTGDAVSRVYARGDADASVGAVDSLGLTTGFVFVAPSVSITRQSTNLVVRWPAGMALERSSILGAGATWQPVSGTILTNALRDYAYLYLPSETRTAGAFFRLRLPGLSGGGECAEPDPEEGSDPCP